MRWLDGVTDSMDVSVSELGVGDGQGSLAYCDAWGCKELDATERLNWTELKMTKRVTQKKQKSGSSELSMILSPRTQ